MRYLIDAVALAAMAAGVGVLAVAAGTVFAYILKALGDYLPLV